MADLLWWGSLTEYPDEGFTPIEAPTQEAALAEARRILGGDDPETPISVHRMTAADVEVLQAEIETREHRAIAAELDSEALRFVLEELVAWGGIPHDSDCSKAPEDCSCLFVSQVTGLLANPPKKITRAEVEELRRKRAAMRQENRR